MKRNIDILLCVLLLISFTQCSESIQEGDFGNQFIQIEPNKGLFNLFGKDKSGYRYGIQDVITKSGSTSTINWLIYRNNLHGAAISVPEEWNYEHQEDLFIYLEIDTIPNNFFLWKRYQKSKYDLNIDDFVNYFHDVITSDSVEICTESIVRKYSYKREPLGFYISCNMKRDKVNNISHSFITHDEKYIHEFTLKHRDSTKNDLNEILFFTTLDGIFFNNQKIIPDINSSSIDISLGLD